MKVLLAEDDRIVRITVRDALEEAGFQVVACADGFEAGHHLETGSIDILLSDVRLPGVDGISLFRRARRRPGEPAVVLMTAYADTEDAVAVMREGARDYLLKPFEMDQLLLAMSRVRDELALRRRLEAGGPVDPGGPILGVSAAVERLRERIDAAAATDVGVLVIGETGTGKDLAARTIHERSRRAGRPFVVVNCAAIPETLLEAELFGHERGAFTGADRRRVGRFETADGGTLFLDEVGDLSPSSQAKVLRAIESSTFEPIGSSKSVRVDVRIIAATNRDLGAAIARGTFRKDLFYRLNVIDILVPPLRERREDVLALAAAFLTEIAARNQLSVPQLASDVAAALTAWDYPGNVRELIHALERAVALARGGEVRVEHLPPDIAAHFARRHHEPAPDVAPAAEPVRPLEEAVGRFEREYIQRALAATGGRRGKAAELLGISRKSLWQRLREVTEAATEPGGGDRS